MTLDTELEQVPPVEGEVQGTTDSASEDFLLRLEQ